MKTRSLRVRVTVLTLSLLVVVLAGVVTTVTLVYRSSLENDLRSRLRSGARQLHVAWPGPASKPVMQSLQLEGIAVDVGGGGSGRLPPAKQTASGIRPLKPGTSLTSSGSLLVFREQFADGTRITLKASRTHIDDSVASLLEIEIAVALAALALAAVLLLRGTSTALRPLAHVARTATRIAGGDRTERLRPSRADTELGAMAAAFDRMVDSLDAAVAQAQTAEEAMRRFLADASHELRTPVAALQAGVETLLREQPPRPRRDELEAGIARDAARLGRLVDDLLGLARLEAHEAPMREPLDLAALAGEAVAQARQPDTAADVSLDLSPGATVLGDSDGLVRALRNLIENALRAAEPAGHVVVSVRRNGSRAEASVRDDGPGVPAGDRERIFERFVRLDSAGQGRGRRGGIGLGLSIARRIARSHGGDITCDEISRGASFTIRLPLCGPEPGPASTA